MMIFRNGWKNIINRQKAMQSMQQKILAHLTGPQSSLPMTKGFKENCMRPTGGGRKGLVLGLVRAAPTGMAKAFSFGQI